MTALSVKLEKSGRILIPAAVRRKLNLSAGSELLLRVDEAGIRIGTRAQALTRVHDRLRKYIPSGRILSQELLDERRQEAKRKRGA
jgi:AbrB family looped-hinge helix DNA binding protein